MSSVGIHLGGAQKLGEQSREMLLPLEAGRFNAHENLGKVMDRINTCFDTGTVKYSQNKPHPKSFEKG